LTQTRLQLFCPTALLRKYSKISRFQTAVLSTPANPGHNDLDEQETGDEGQNQEQIKIFFRHCPWLSMKEIEQCRCRYEMKIRSAEIDRGFLKSP
jgi:hypothetical protein